jgi:hypothetical protein
MAFSFSLSGNKGDGFHGAVIYAYTAAGAFSGCHPGRAAGQAQPGKKTATVTLRNGILWAGTSGRA